MSINITQHAIYWAGPPNNLTPINKREQVFSPNSLIWPWRNKNVCLVITPDVRFQMHLGSLEGCVSYKEIKGRRWSAGIC